MHRSNRTPKKDSCQSSCGGSRLGGLDMPGDIRHWGIRDWVFGIFVGGGFLLAIYWTFAAGIGPFIRQEMMFRAADIERREAAKAQALAAIPVESLSPGDREVLVNAA